MILYFLQVVSGFVMLYFGGEQLVRGADSVGRYLGMSSLLLGLTIVAFGTSAPELAVSIDAAITGRPDIAITNVIGSNLTNIGLVGAFVFFTGQVKASSELIRRDLPAMMLSFALCIYFLHDWHVSRLEGAILFIMLVVYTAYIFFDHKAEPNKEEQDSSDKPSLSAKTLLQVLIGIVLLALGGDMLVSGASSIALQFGMSEALIGLTLVAVGTSLPELATSISAARLGHGGMAIGNIIGTNIWNSLGVLGMTAAIIPIPISGLEWHMLIAMVLASCIFWWMLAKQIQWAKINGSILLSGYLAYQCFVIL